MAKSKYQKQLEAANRLGRAFKSEKHIANNENLSRLYPYNKYRLLVTCEQLFALIQKGVYPSHDIMSEDDLDEVEKILFPYSEGESHVEKAIV